MPTTRLRPRRSPSGFCCASRKSSPLPTASAYRPSRVRVAGPEVGQQGQAGQRRIGFPVGALAEAGLAGGAVGGEVVVALDGRAVVVPGDPGVPAAVVVLVAGQPVERALDGQLAGGTRADPLRLRRAVGVEPRMIDLGDLREASGRPVRSPSAASPRLRQQPRRLGQSPEPAESVRPASPRRCAPAAAAIWLPVPACARFARGREVGSARESPYGRSRSLRSNLIARLAAVPLRSASCRGRSGRSRRSVPQRE